MIRKSRLLLLLIMVACVSLATSILAPPQISRAAAGNYDLLLYVGPSLNLPAPLNAALNYHNFEVPVTSSPNPNVYEVLVTNSGTAGGSFDYNNDIVVSGTLGAGLTVTPASPFTDGNWNCTVTGGNQISCTYATSGTLAVGGQLPVLSIPLTVTTGAAPTAITSNLRVDTTSATTEPTTTNNGANATVAPAGGCAAGSVCTTVTLYPDIKPVWGTPSSSYTVGTQGTVPITIQNQGNGPTSGPITVNFTVTGGTGNATLNSGSGTNWSCLTATSCTWNSGSTLSIGTLQSTNQLLLNVTPTAAGTFTITAAISGGGEPAALSGNDSADILITAIAAPDLSITMPTPGSGGMASAFVDGNYTDISANAYHITVTNANGAGNTPASANTVVKVELVSSGQIFAGAAAFTSANPGSPFTCVISGSPPVGVTQEIVCTRTTTFNANTSVDLVIPLNISAPPPGPVQAYATVSVNGESASTLTNNNTQNTSSPNPYLVPVQGLNFAIAKTIQGSLTSVDVGNTLIYNIAVTNPANANSSPNAGNITVTDTLPVGMLFVSQSPMGPGTWNTCSAPAPAAGAAQVVTCVYPVSAGAISQGNAAPVLNLTVSAGPAAWGTGKINSATVATPGDVTAGDNTATASIDVHGYDIAVTSFTHPGTFQETIPSQFDIAIQNNGDTDTTNAAQIVATIKLPANFTFTPAAITDWTCAGAGSPVTVTCNYTGGVIAGGGTPFSPITLNVTPGVGTTCSVGCPATTVKVTDGPALTFTDDVNTANNTASNPTSPVLAVPAPNLVVSKAHAGDPFIQNDTSVNTYTLTVTNLGGSTSGTIKVTDTLNATVSLVSATGTDWTCTPSGIAPVGTTVSCTYTDPTPLTPVATNETLPDITLVVDPQQTTPPAGSGGTISNTATVTLNNANAHISNVDQVTVVAPIAPDLTIKKTHASNVTVGQPVTYSIVVTNTGGAATSAASTVTVTEQLPANFSLTSAAGTGWTCPVAQPSTAPVALFSCTASLASGFGINATMPTLTVIAIPQNTGTGNPPSATFQNVVTVSSSPAAGVDTDTSNNSWSDPTVVVLAAGADLKLVADTSTVTFPAGGQGTYNVTVSNTGNLATSAGNTVVTVTLPSSGFLTFAPLGSGGNGWTCDPEVSHVVTCRNPVIMNAGGTGGDTLPVLPINVNVAPGAANTSVITHFAVNGPNTDVTPADNSTDVTTQVVGQATFTVVKSHPADFVVGTQGTYRFDITNSGTSIANATALNPITLTDALPANLTLVSGGGSDGWGICTGTTTSTATCKRTTPLAVGATTTLTLTVQVGVGTPSTFNNTGTLTFLTVTQDSNVDSSFLGTPGQSNISISKALTGQLVAGSAAQYTMTVRNTGLGATNATVVVTETVPAGLSFTNGGGNGFTCSGPAAGPVNCSYSSVAFPATTTVTFPLNFTVTAVAGQSITNTASVNQVANDPNSSNKTASTTPSIVQPAATVDPTKSCISVSNAGPILANNLTSTTVTVTVKDTLGNLMTSKAVQVTASSMSSGLTLSPSVPTSGTTGSGASNGIATFTFTASTPGTVTFQAVVDGQTISNTCGGTATVTFSSTTALNPGHSTLSASPTTVAADGTAFSTVTAHVLTNTDAPVVGASVVLTYTTNTGNTTGITPASGSTATTNSNGDATFQLKSSTNQIVTLTATASVAGQTTIQLTQHPAVTFGTGGTTTTGNTTTVTTDCVSVAADNIQVANISISAKDAAGAALTGKTFTLAGAPVLSGMTIQPASAVTDATGLAKFTVRSTSQGGPVTFTATNTTDASVLTQTVQVTFTKPGTKCVASTTATAAPTSPSDGTVITALLCIRTGPGFGYARYSDPLKFRTVVRVLGRTTRVPGLGVKDNCIHRGGPTWYFVQLADGRTVWANANYIRLASRLAFNTLPVLPTPPLPGQPGAGQAAVNGIVGGPAAKATPKP